MALENLMEDRIDCQSHPGYLDRINKGEILIIGFILFLILVRSNRVVPVVHFLGVGAAILRMMGYISNACLASCRGPVGVCVRVWCAHADPTAEEEEDRRRNT